MKKGLALLVFILCLLLNNSSFAQLEADHWMFNNQGYVFFNGANQPEVLRYPFRQLIPLAAGTISYSDENGNLLFYGGGGFICDRNFHVFPSLDISNGGYPLHPVSGSTSRMQSMLCLPYPGHDSLFIVFHIRSEYNNQYQSPLYYSIINMNLRNGLGEIEPGKRNIPLLNGVNVGFKLTAVLHCNKKDIWVIGHLDNSDKYFSLLVTQAGISQTPVYFSGSFIAPKYKNGCIKVSPLGNRLAAAFQDTSFVELFDFNTQTGLGSNLKTITAHPPLEDTLYLPFHSGYGPVGVDFSPSGNRLYVTSNFDLKRTSNGYGYGAYIYQFAASLPTASQIQSSQYEVDRLDGYTSGAIQMGNNGKMYVNVDDNLSEIADPEGQEAACRYTRFTVRSGQQYANRNLPTFLQSYFRYPIITTGNCQFQNIDFSVKNTEGINAVLWDFGDPASGANNSSTSFSPTHIYSAEGVYTARAVLINSNGCGADTITKLVHAGPFKVYLGNDTTICLGDTLKLKMKVPGATNKWSNNETDTVLNITQSGTYWVRVRLGECSATDTIQVMVRPLPSFSLGSDTTVCNGQPLLLVPDRTLAEVNYLWSTGSALPEIEAHMQGTYWLKVTDDYGCSVTDTIAVLNKSLPVFSLGEDTTLCQADFSLNATVQGASSYSWSTGAVTPVITANQPGTYWAEVTRDNCTFRDSIMVTLKPYPSINLGKDTALCEGTTLILDAQNPGSFFQWQDGSVSQTFTVQRPGVYTVKVSADECASRDTINILYVLKPVFSLRADLTICPGQEFAISPDIENSQAIAYLWQDGSREASYKVTTPGVYSLQLTNVCGTKTDSLVVSKGICKFYVPTAFTPNRDGRNDLFKVSSGEPVSNFKMEVYNRWGQRVFASDDPKKGWDGQFAHRLQPVGAYVWIIRYKPSATEKEKVLKGVIMLLQ